MHILSDLAINCLTSFYLRCLVEGCGLPQSYLILHQLVHASCVGDGDGGEDAPVVQSVGHVAQLPLDSQAASGWHLQQLKWRTM